MGERHSAADFKRPSRQRGGLASGARSFAPHPSRRCGCRRDCHRASGHHQRQHQLELQCQCCTAPRGCDAGLRGHRSSQRSSALAPRGAALAAPPPKPCSSGTLLLATAAAAEPQERRVGPRSRALAVAAPTAAASAPATSVGLCRPTGWGATVASCDGCTTTTAGLGRFL